jgi:ParB/RepB/Spo0J family partition protein
MAARTSDKLAALKARVKERVAPPPAEPADGAAEAAAPLAGAVAHFTGAIADLVQGRVVERIQVTEIAPALHGDERQARLLPPPHELLAGGGTLPEYAAIVGELSDLADSLRERQVQPIIVYPGASPLYPGARYLILVGQRRWSAAMLSGIAALDAIVVEPPSPEERVKAQYEENERRENFTDMERAWALAQMKEVLGDVPWETVEARMDISRTRRHELTRLLTSFTPDQQRAIALLRGSEVQLRPLHTAVRNGELSPEQAGSVIDRLMHLVLERESRTEGLARRAGVDGPTVARLVARIKRAGEAPSGAPRWLGPLRDSLGRGSAGLKRALDRVPALRAGEAAALRGDLDELEQLIAQVRQALLARDADDGDDDGPLPPPPSPAM